MSDERESETVCRQEWWHVDVRVPLADGSQYRERKRLTVSKSAARRWGQERERYLLLHGKPRPTKEVPTLEEFAERFLNGHARANRQKPSGIAAKATILNRHLIPMVGDKKLDAITTDDYDKLVQAASRMDVNTYGLVLLGGDAGLRLGAMMALEWSGVDLHKRLLTVQHSEWKGHVTATKGGRLRHVPMTERLAMALRALRHLRGSRGRVQSNGEPLTMKIVQNKVANAAGERGAAWRPHSSAHVLFAPSDARSTS